MNNLKINSLADAVYHRITNDLRSCGYKTGSKLPSVVALAKRYAVSDRTIQNAMGQLQREGIIESHVGRGSFVIKVPKAERSADDKAFERFGSDPANTIAILDGQSEVDLTQEHAESWTTRIVHGMRCEAANEGIDLLLLNDPLRIKSLTKRLLDLGPSICGVITFPFADYRSLLELFDNCYVPVLMINRPCAKCNRNYVDADYFGGSKRVGQLFAKAGFKNVWMVSTQMVGIFSKEQRYQGLCEGLKMSGSEAEVKVLVADSAGDESSYSIAKDLLGKGDVPDGVYCSGDYLAIGVMRAARERGIKIGESGGISIVGSSGFEISRYTDPSLSVLEIPMIEMGRVAVQKIFEMRKSKSLQCEGVTLETKLILRDSTCSTLRGEWLERTSGPNDHF